MLSIYIHIPFCLKKCNYCGFISFDNYKNEIDNYIFALEKEIKLSVNHNKIKDRQVNTIFFGGGTPSILSILQLNKIFQCIKKYFNIVENCETTIEINPATSIDFIGLQSVGFNRISIGVQSFNDKELSFLERMHNSNTAEKTIIEAKKYFDNVSIDLIYGIPNQTFNSFENNINTAMSFGVKHISAYSLTYEEETKLTAIKNTLPTISIDIETKMYEMLCSKLEKNCFNQYEISNFAIKNYECKHNKNYWDRNDYIGFGIAAHSCLENVRFSNTTDLKNYFDNLEKNKLPIIEKECLKEEDIYEEKIFLGLRSSGIDKSLLNDTQSKFMKECIKAGFSKDVNNLFVLTSNGKFITDSIVLNILKRK